MAATLFLDQSIRGIKYLTRERKTLQRDFSITRYLSPPITVTIHFRSSLAFATFWSVLIQSNSWWLPRTVSVSKGFRRCNQHIHIDICYGVYNPETLEQPPVPQPPTMHHRIPRTQVAAIVPGPKQPVVVQHHFPVTRPSELKPGQCLVKMICPGVCHSDLHLSRGDWILKPAIPLIGGHEGVGEVVAIGENSEQSPVKLGQRVGIKWLAYCCRDCERCLQGHEQSMSFPPLRWLKDLGVVHRRTNLRLRQRKE